MGLGTYVLDSTENMEYIKEQTAKIPYTAVFRDFVRCSTYRRQLSHTQIPGVIVRPRDSRDFLL